MLALGTVQFGLDYGISNIQGQVSSDSIDDILTIAKVHHINTLDCALAYGNSQKTLGKLKASQHFDIVTKIPKLKDNEVSILPYFNKSLNDLNRTCINTLLLHDVNTLLQHPNSTLFCNELKQLKVQNKVKQIGVSVYSPEQIEQTTEKLTIDIVQAPLNVFDQRCCDQGILNIFKEQNIKLHIRSVFLQGLLLMENGTWPEYFSPYLDYLTKFDQLSKKLSTSKLTLALAFIIQNSSIKPYVEKIVVGCCSKNQLQQILQSYQQAKSLTIDDINWASFACNAPALINPNYWPN